MGEFKFKKIDYWGQTADVTRLQRLPATSFTEKTAIKNYRARNLQILSRLNEIADVPKKDEHFRFMTCLAFNGFSWIDFFCEKFETFEEVYIASYTYSEAPITILFEKFDSGQFEKLSLIIPENLRIMATKRFFQIKNGLEERANLNLRAVCLNNHSKFMMLKPKNTNDYFIVEGSGNFSFNANIEQYSLDNSKQIYQWRRVWLERDVFNPSAMKLKNHFLL